MSNAEALEQFISLATAGDLVRLQLTRPPDAGGAERLQLRPLTLRGAACWQGVWKHPSKDLTENWPATEGAARLRAWLQGGWRSAALWTPAGHWQLDQQRSGAWKLVRHRDATPAATLSGHNRAKQHLLDLGHPLWVALGVAEAGRGGEPRVVPAMARKWKQINRFTELLQHALLEAGLDRAPLRVADFGCGRGYLTFAVALLLAGQGCKADVLGVELRAELVEQTETLARQFAIEGLHFAQGDVGHQSVQPLDLMIALHACDTATDVALHHALRAGASVILAAPCCHKQLRGQLQPPSALRPLFRHGVHLGQEAEMVTDGMRALLLESQGYDCRVIEFISLEHTQKNKMLVAIRRRQPDAARDARAAAELDALRQFWGIREQHLERLLHPTP